jgi:uncharacterized protein with HEPN domain
MTTKPGDPVLIDHLIEAIELVLQYTRSMSEADFLNERMVQDAVIRNFTVMGEAVKKLGPSIRESYPHIEWKKIAGMRDKLVHDYMGIDKAAVWLTVHRILPSLLNELVKIKNEIK